jgi:two-component system sensor histidine kinase and response regulator WspE
MSMIDSSMFDLFREEVRSHAETLAQGLILTEGDPGNASLIEPLMRAAHSIKGACRIVGIDLGVRLSHVMEDALVAAQHGTIRLTPADVDVLLQGSDILAGLARLTPETTSAWETAHQGAIERLEPLLQAIATGLPPASPGASPAPEPPPAKETASPPPPGPSGENAPAENGFPSVPMFSARELPSEPLVLASDHSMFDLFREEVRAHLLVVESTSDRDAAIESLKQLRGAARIMKCRPVERVAEALTAYWQAMGNRAWPREAKEWLRFAVSTLVGVMFIHEDEYRTWLEDASANLELIAEEFRKCLPALSAKAESRSEPVAKVPPPAPPPRVEPAPAAAKPEPAPAPMPAPPPGEAVVRVTAQSLNRLMGLAGESLVQARWLPSFSTALLRLKRQHDRLASMLEGAFHATMQGRAPDQLAQLLGDARRQASLCRTEIVEQTIDFDDHAARAEDLNARLYREVIVSRMRPFGDGVHGLPRLVRDMARSLGKEARVVIEGEQTEVDRDILEKLESPLSHLVRNGVDHGLELPEVRTRAGKQAAGAIRVEARHRAGMLQLTVSDDGAGIDLDRLRHKIVEKGLNSAEVVRQLNEAELLEFLFLPGFSTAAAVTEFSGRGVGLDVVQDTIRKVGGSVRITTQLGRGTTFHLQLPLTLSVIRAVVVDINGEAYAFPHTRIDRLIRARRTDVRSLEHRQFLTVDGHNVGLVVTAQLLDLPPGPASGDELAVVLMSDATGIYGLVVDSFRGEQDLVVRPLDPRLGKVPNLSAAAILDDGSPVLIVDAEDLLRTTEQFIQSGSLKRCETRITGRVQKKRVLVVDDSITVREVERQLLLHKGYDVSVAVDGMDGWNKVRADRYDLLVSDIDMPRMTGLQLVAAVRGDEKLRDLPIVIVSYKEREEDRLRGLEAGANSYLTKSSFHDNRFIESVEDLIGPA